MKQIVLESWLSRWISECWHRARILSRETYFYLLILIAIVLPKLS